MVTGDGPRAFCAGNDLKYHATGAPIAVPATGFAGLTKRYDLAKPIIAAVNGLALGGGFETALACYIVVAGARVTFGLPEPRVVLSALAGGLLRLSRAIGLKRGMPLILTGQPVSAEEGYRLGFVSEIVAPGGELPRALARAEAICACSPAGIRAANQVAIRGLDLPLAEAMAAQFDWPAVTTVRALPDWLEGPRTFTEKRPPRWSGR